MDLSKPTKHNHPNRRRGDLGQQPDQRDGVEARLSIVEAKLDKYIEQTAPIVDVFGNLEAGIKVLGALGTFAKWLAPIVALCATIYALFNGKSLDK